MPTTTVDSLQYHFREEGRGPLVILGHSDASTSAQWRTLMTKLRGEFRMRAFDTAGQGRSDPWPEGRPYSVAAESRIVDALAASEAAAIHLVGHSAGGMFLLGAAMRLAERIASLTLIEPVMFSLLRQAGEEAARAEVRAVGERFQSLFRAGRAEEAMAGFVDYWTPDRGWAAVPEEKRAPMVAAAAKIFLQWDAAFSEDYSLADIALLSCPTLLIRGSATTLAARAVSDVLHRTLPECWLVEIEGAGHMSPVTHTEAVNSHIADHLRAQR